MIPDVVDHVGDAVDSLRDAREAADDDEVEELLTLQIQGFARFLDALRYFADGSDVDQDTDDGD